MRTLFLSLLRAGLIRTWHQNHFSISTNVLRATETIMRSTHKCWRISESSCVELPGRVMCCFALSTFIYSLLLRK